MSLLDRVPLVTALRGDLERANATIAARDQELAVAHAQVARLTAELANAHCKIGLLSEENERLRHGLFGQRAERYFTGGDADNQRSFDFMRGAFGCGDPPAQSDSDSPPPPVEPAPPATPVQSAPAPEATSEATSGAPESTPRLRPISPRKGRKPVRKPLPENLPRVIINQTPGCVLANPDAYVKIGETRSEVLEKTASMIVVAVTVREKFKLKDDDSFATKIEIAPVPELPIPGSTAGPGLLADVATRHYAEHAPFHRLEQSYKREGIELARSTMVGWMQALSGLLRVLIQAMFEDARRQELLCIDATGVLVQALKRCARGHFWLMLTLGRHALFRFSMKHNSAEVAELTGDGYRGKVLADAHSVYNYLYGQERTECGCWSHCRRYFFQALESDPERANAALERIQWLFVAERVVDTADQRQEIRRSASRPTVEAFFAWVELQREDPAVLDGSPIAKALNYAHNQRKALEAFLDDERVPMHNNAVERMLRHIAVGRKNWLFVGSQAGGETTAMFVSLILSCQMHGIEPWSYLRDLFCLLPQWPVHQVLDLAPVNWNATLARPDVQQKLAANIYRSLTLPSAPASRNSRGSFVAA